MRNSAKFHHPDFELTDQFFAHHAHELVRTFISRPPVLGAQITPPDFDESTQEYFYLSPAAIKRGHLNENALRSITEKFFLRYHRRIGLQRNDVLIGASGECTIEKSAVYESDLRCVISQFIMRVRFGQSMNPLFASYFFRSVMFQAQVEREKRGMGNMTNIFPSQG